MTLGWPLRDAWVTLGGPNPNRNPNPDQAEGRKCPNTKRNGFPLRTSDGFSSPIMEFSIANMKRIHQQKSSIEPENSSLPFLHFSVSL